jgi:plastocyanin
MGRGFLRDLRRPKHRAGASLVAVLLAGACAPAAAPATPALEVTVATGPGEERFFTPDPVAVPADTTVRIVLANASSQAHNLTFQAPIAGATRTIVDAGAMDAVVIRTPAPGLYRFVCTIHMDMAGRLAVE